MIVGNGVDILDIERIRDLISRNPRFVARFFTDKEQLLFNERQNKIETIAANFAAKEAVSKALGTGVRGFNLSDIEILRDKVGKPYIVLYNEADVIAKDLGISEWMVSLSHSDHQAIAFVIAVKKL